MLLLYSSYQFSIAVAAALAVLCGFGAAKNEKNKVWQIILILLTALLVAFVFFRLALMYG